MTKDNSKAKKPKKQEQPFDRAEKWVSRDVPNDAQEITQAGPTYDNPNKDEVA